jgi:hypothetical protein
MAKYDVVNVQPFEHLKLRVQFEDGLSGVIRIEPAHLYGVFEALKDPAVFFQAHCEQGFVSWPGEIDLAPDAMYQAIRDKGEWVLS